MQMWRLAPCKEVEAEAEVGAVTSSMQRQRCPWRTKMRHHGCHCAELLTARGSRCGMPVRARARVRPLLVPRRAGSHGGVMADRPRKNLRVATLAGERASTIFSLNEFISPLFFCLLLIGYADH